MNTKILGFTATDNSHQKDIYIVNFDESKIKKNTKLPIKFKFGLFNYKKGDAFIADFTFKNEDGTIITHQLILNNIITNNDGMLKKNGEYYSSQFSFNVPLIIKEGTITCEMTLKKHNNEIAKATTYFALKKL